MMEAMKEAIRHMIPVSDTKLDTFADLCSVREVPRKAFLAEPGAVSNEVYFIESGIIRVVVTDNDGNEHTVHFALENQFVTDYASFLQEVPSIYHLQAMEDTRVIVLPRKAIEWGYATMRYGDRLGRIIAEGYFIYHDQRIRNLYSKTPKERYDDLTQVFPNIHNRVPQHMIASYLGITPVHLSRLKKADLKKV